MKCVPKTSCDFNAVITDDFIADTPQLNALRVPLIPCINRERSNMVDVCCRDPNFKDPWPKRNNNNNNDQEYNEDYDQEYDQDYGQVAQQSSQDYQEERRPDIDVRNQNKKKKKKGHAYG